MFPEGRALELLIAAVVALIVVGPKDLPVLLRKLGQFMAKVRSMAAEFRASFDEMARQSELDELRKEVEAMRHGQLTDIATHAPEVNQAFNEISQGLADVGVQLNSPVSPPFVAAQTSHLEDAPASKPRTRKASAKTPPKAVAARKSAAPKAADKGAIKPSAKQKGAALKRVTPKSVASKTSVKASSKGLAQDNAAKAAASSKPRTRKASTS